MTFEGLRSESTRYGLFIMGALHDDGDTVLLLGADRLMWPIFKASCEYRDGKKDALDRWSKRVIGDLAKPLNGHCAFPSDGPPYLPFIAWAKATNRFWQSPTGMLVHDTAGLMISIRGAIRLEGVIPIAETPAVAPCDTCADKPCTVACPVDALTGHSMYDVPVCKSFLRRESGADCMKGGCLARRACPVSQSFDRPFEQSAFHMRAFV